jgi:hypothetical protein
MQLPEHISSSMTTVLILLGDIKKGINRAERKEIISNY